MAPCSSALEAGVRQPIVHQVSDAVYRVLEKEGGGEHEHPDRWIDEGDDVEGEKNRAFSEGEPTSKCLRSLGSA
jgi:hypothetical protein